MNTNTYLLLFIVSTSASLALTPLVGHACRRAGWLDEPCDARRLHRTAIPRLGGAAIFSAILVALVAFLFTSNLVRTNSAQLAIVLVPAALIFVLGVYDDLRGTNAPIKFAAQVVAGLLFCAMGGRITALSVPLVGSIALTPVVGYALTVLWTVGVSNAFNLIDGLDGLATGASLFAALVILVVSLMLGHPLIAIVAIVLCGSLIGFLPYNFNPASIFLGDSGSLFIGFTLAALSIQGAQKASTAVAVAIPLIAFGVPVFDTGFSIMRRLIGGRPLFQGDREHIHHMLMARGWSQRRVALVLYGASALFALLALLLVNDPGMRTTGLVLFVVGAAIMLVVGRFRYHEVDEVKASMRRGFAERRLRVANNVRVRRASRAMSEANTLGEILNATQQLLELGEFTYATMQFGGGQDAQRSEQALARERKELLMRGAEIRNGSVSLHWKRRDTDAGQIMGSGSFWTLRLPLSTQNAEWGYLNLYREFGADSLLLDINYLCDLFQRETSKAVERVLGANEYETDVPQLVVTLPASAEAHELVWAYAGPERRKVVPLRVAV
jgi:UDP-GlcNAc:undecaprenyl-phosphate GlcNAc-1-phosphate transferase